MDEIKKTENDAYDELLKSFSVTSNKDSTNEVKNHGEIYFSMNSRSGSKSVSGQNSTVKNNVTQKPAQSNRKPAVAPDRTQKNNTKNKKTVKSNTGSSSKKATSSSSLNSTDKKALRKKKKRMNTLKNSIIAILIVVFVFVSAFLIKIPIMGCINDVLAIDVSSDDLSVILPEDSDVDEVIDLLADKNLINNPLFCKLFVRIMGFYDRVDAKGETKLIVYPAGEYYLNSGMGLEGMLNEIRTKGVDTNTIVLTFPEGYNVNQIVEKLDSNGVCSAESLYAVMRQDEIYEKYEFLSSISNRDSRYMALEGFLYPDTYEFYIGESPLSVLERFLNNFEKKWDDAYQTKADELGYTVDEIITIASIIEKEAKDSEQMFLVSSILYNRLNSSTFPKLECDSTMNYIEVNKSYLSSDRQYSELMKIYDTYQTAGLPAGAICCPGADAIYAALYFQDTDYYFFAHDKAGTIYLAQTMSQHEINLAEIDKVNAKFDEE